MLKQIWGYFTFAIGWGSFILALNIVHMYITGSDAFQHFYDNPIAVVLWHFVIGLGFFGTAIVYEIQALSFRLKLLVHVVVGIGLFLLASFYLGWGITENPANLLLSVAVYIGIIFAVWVVLYMRDKKEVLEINKVLEEQNHKKPLDTQ